MARVKVGDKGYVEQRMRDKLDKPRRAERLGRASDRNHRKKP